MKKVFLILLCGLLGLSGKGFGQGLIFSRTMEAPMLGPAARVVPTPDNGTAVFSGDSLQVVKLSPCGRVEWAKQYRLAGYKTLPGAHDMTVLAGANGGFALLTRVRVGGDLSAPLVVCLDAAGGVRWSIVLSEPTFDHYPYTIGQDQQGNLVIYGIAVVGTAGESFNFLTKISGTGAVLWSHRYGLGVIWGGALNTSDNGVLARTGSRFIKTDAAGQVQWTSSVIARRDDSYYAPVEVADGYIYSSYAANNQQISFYKIDKQGRLLWGGRKTTDFLNRPPLLRLRPNGHLVGVYNRRGSNGNSHATLVELDADLRVIRQRSLPAGLTAADLCLATDGAPVLMGRLGAGSLFLNRTDTAFQLSPVCDTVLAAPQITLDSAVIQEFLTPATLPFAPTTQAVSVTASAFNPTQTTLCAAPLNLTLGPDTAFCDGAAPLLLRNRRADLFEQYRWSTGATTAAISVTQPGTYWLRATINCGLDTLTDSITIGRTIVPAPTRSLDTIRCSDDPVLLDARVSGAATYRWPDGSANPQFLAADTGRYTVSITLDGCTRRVEYHIGECERLIMPNIFSPNADRLNDRFVPIEMRGIASATLEVYNRWGQRVATTNDIRRTGWDGTAGGRLCAAATYFYLVRYTTVRQQQKTVKGYVELVW